MASKTFPGSHDLLDDLVASKGHSTPEVEAARAEITRLRTVYDAH